MCCSAATPASLGTMPATIPSLPMLAVPLTLLVGQVDVKLQGGSTPTPASQNALAWILQSASAINAASPASSSRVLIGPGLPTISKQLLDRKQKWEYVDIWWTCFHPRAPMTRLWGCTHPPPPQRASHCFQVATSVQDASRSRTSPNGCNVSQCIQHCQVSFSNA